jgi:hypothetical protein
VDAAQYALAVGEAQHPARSVGAEVDDGVPGRPDEIQRQAGHPVEGDQRERDEDGHHRPAAQGPEQERDEQDEPQTCADEPEHHVDVQNPTD